MVTSLLLPDAIVSDHTGAATVSGARVDFVYIGQWASGQG
jgi:hypothetical protein